MIFGVCSQVSCIIRNSKSECDSIILDFFHMGVCLLATELASLRLSGELKLLQTFKKMKGLRRQDFGTVVFSITGLKKEIQLSLSKLVLL